MPFFKMGRLLISAGVMVINGMNKRWGKSSLWPRLFLVPLLVWNCECLPSSHEDWAAVTSAGGPKFVLSISHHDHIIKAD